MLFFSFRLLLSLSKRFQFYGSSVKLVYLLRLEGLQAQGGQSGPVTQLNKTVQTMQTHQVGVIPRLAGVFCALLC
jgi:hypothetical protein